MRINNIKFKDSITSSVGLKEVKFDRLGSVVALIGRNGSGKTRVLDLIEKEIVLTIDDFLNNNVLFSPESVQNELNILLHVKEYYFKKERLVSLNNLRLSNPNDKDLLQETRTLANDVNAIAHSLVRQEKSIIKKTWITAVTPFELEQEIDRAKKRFNEQLKRFKSDYIKRVDYSQVKQLQETISSENRTLNSFEDLIESLADNIGYNELSSIQASSLRFLKKLPHQLAYDWVECMGITEQFEKRKSYLRFKSLKDIFEDVLGKSLSWESQSAGKSYTDSGVQATYSGIWKINGREFNYKEFSEGEKVLLAYVLMFFLISQNDSIRLKESIIIIDEPELHLHPDAEIDLINGIRRIIEDKGQLWIATHSINILSQLNINEVFVVKDGEVSHPKNTIQREALSELMKIDERVEKLSEFITSISDWTYVQFMIECFTDPEVIEIAKKDDPQIKSLKELVNLSGENKKKALLDFGAGKGRLFEQVSTDANFSGIINYSALEPNINMHSSLTSKGVQKIYSSYDDLNGDKFDFILLCNVLHEVDIDDWVPILNRIIDSLNPEGYLIIIEAKRLTKGEQIGKTGYLLLDEQQIQTLFGLKELVFTFKEKEEYKNITSVLLPKKEMIPITTENLNKALEQLRDKSISEIEALRSGEGFDVNSNKFGRQAAFLSQQHINTVLALKHINRNS